jgi:hypothetical protein
VRHNKFFKISGRLPQRLQLHFHTSALLCSRRHQAITHKPITIGSRLLGANIDSPLQAVGYPFYPCRGDADIFSFLLAIFV